MKLAIGNRSFACLAMVSTLHLEVKAEDKINNNDNENSQAEDFAFWRGLIDSVDSFPVASPTLQPVEPIADPTAPPVIPVADPTNSPISPEPVPVECRTIAEVVCSTPEFEALCSLVNAADLYEILNSSTLTLFAPTGEAFDNLPDELINAALSDINLLTFVLSGHAVSNQEILTSDLSCENGPIDSLIMANDEVTTVRCDEKITFVVGGGNVNPSSFPQVIGPNGAACNGIIHAINEVILPTPEESPTDTPIVTTLAPTTPTNAPVAPTDAPVVPTNAPIVPTNAPVAPTDAPVAPTTAPITPTAQPVAPTPSPVTPTDAPTVGTSEVQARLIPFILNGGAEFEDPNSYQSQALRQTEAQVGVDEFTDAKLTQYYALYSIFFATNGVPNQITDADPRFEGIPFPNWLVTTGWESTDVDPCEWYGIVCDSESRVSTIDLFENLLTGAFPPEVALLSLDGPYATGAGNLFRIDLFRNEFVYNNADNSWMTDLGSNMTTIIAEETAFAGNIPRLPDNLVNFDISFAFFTGGLTDGNFEGLEKLSFIDLDGNAFNSTIPSVFGRLPSLEFLYLSDSFLSGDLSYMEGMQSIREHWIDTNPGLKGPIFDFIGDITTLESWSMTFNSVTGTIPSALGNLASMQQMWLYSNDLTGTIPSTLGQLENMQILQVEGNQLSGSMPTEVCANTAFPTMIIETLGADCDLVNCPCCTCCSVVECSSS